jgi:hypothetical protein
MASDTGFRHEDNSVDVAEAEQFGALAKNWLEAEEVADDAASAAFEDELHERITRDEINRIQGLDAASGEPSLAETEQLRKVLERMWNNASVRLD